MEFPEAPVIERKRDQILTLESFSYLWKVDDPEWVAQREADWDEFLKPVFKDYPKDEKKVLKNYFMYGEMKRYYPVLCWFFLTPYESLEDLKKLFNSGVVDFSDIKKLNNYYLTYDLYRFSSCPWYRDHMEIYKEAFFSSEYCIIKEGRRTISPMPTWWSEIFVRNSIEAITNQDAWRPVYLCVDYFVSILPFALISEDRPRIELKKLMDLVDQTLLAGLAQGELLDFLEKLKIREQDIWDAWELGEQKIAAGLEVTRE